MKTRDLIARLTEMDPDAEVVVGGFDIHYVDQLPGYYDGCYQTLIRHPDGFFPLGVRIRRDGSKVVIRTLSADDVVFELGDRAVVEYGDENVRSRWSDSVTRMIAESREIHDDVERNIFVRWVADRVDPGVAASFWNHHYTARSPMPDDIRGRRGPAGEIPSWADRRNAQYEREVSLDGGWPRRISGGVT